MPSRNGIPKTPAAACNNLPANRSSRVGRGNLARQARVAGTRERCRIPDVDSKTSPTGSETQSRVSAAGAEVVKKISPTVRSHEP
jgi:hypothetical protein